MTGGAQADSVFWRVGSSAPLGADTDFAGTIMAQTSISLLTNADVNGRLLAMDGAVTLQSNSITHIPEPSSGLLVLAGGITGLLYRRRRRIC